MNRHKIAYNIKMMGEELSKFGHPEKKITDWVKWGLPKDNAEHDATTTT